MLKTTDRRTFLKRSLMVAACISFPVSAFARIPVISSTEKRLSFFNIHTGESVRDLLFWDGREYVLENIARLDQLLRDHRTNEIHNIDPELFDILFALTRRLDSSRPFHIISGYRSPKTNAMLRQGSSGVASRSLHMKGMAIDIRMPGRDLSSLRKAAVALKGGGVGFYPDSDFVHIDTGRVRYW